MSSGTNVQNAGLSAALGSFSVSGNETHLTQIHLQQGDVFSFDYDFTAGDYMPYDDTAYYSISPTGAGSTLSSVSQVGDYGDSGVHQISFTAPSTGDYTITFGVKDVGDGNLPSTLAITNQYATGANEYSGDDASDYISPDIAKGLKDAGIDILKLTAKAAYFAATSAGEAAVPNSPHPSIDAFFDEASTQVEIFANKLETSENKAGYLGVAYQVGTTIGSAINEVIDTGSVGSQSEKAFKDLSTAMLSGAVGEIVGGGTTALVAGIVGTATTATIGGALLPVLAGVAVGALVAGAADPYVGAVVEFTTSHLSNLVGGANVAPGGTSYMTADDKVAPIGTASQADLTTLASVNASASSTGATHDGMTVGSAAPTPAWTYNSDTHTFQWISPPSSDTLQKLSSYIDQSVSKSVVAEVGSVGAGGTITASGGQEGTGALAGDHDPNGYDLSVVDVAGGKVGAALAGQYGHLTLNADGSYTYIADKTSALTSDVHDVFLYTVDNGHGGTALSTLDITVQSATSGQALFGTVTTDPHSAGGQVYALYEGILGRAPDAGGLEYYADQIAHGTAPASLAANFLASPEGQARLGAADDTSFIQQLYQNTLGRAPDSAGLQYHLDELAHGASRVDVADNFVFSPEFTSTVQQAISGGLFVPDAQASEVARLYYTMLGRAPDAGGLAYWTDQINHGGSASDLAQGFLNSPENQATYGKLSNSAYVDALYVNALGRHAEADGLSYWTAHLDQGESRADLAVQLSQSAEAQNVHLAQIEQGWHLA